MQPRWLFFFLVVLTLFGGQHFFLYRRLVRDTTRPSWQRRLGMALFALLLLTLASAGFVYRLLPGWATRLYASAAWTWLGVSLYLFLSLLLLEPWRWWALRRRRLPVPLNEQRRRLLSRAAAGTAFLATGGVSGFGVWRAFQPPEISELSLKLPGLPRELEGFTLVQLSDLHLGGIVDRRFLQETVRRCNALQPDLVAITGDLVDGNVPTLGPVVSALRELKSRHGSYFVHGNHEYYSGVEEWTQALPGMGVTVLRNRSVRIGEASAAFQLVGVDDWSQRRFGIGYDLQAALAGREPSLPAVLLAHQPANFKVAAEQGIGLQLSGHTHGGQLFPGTLLVPYLWEHSAGHYTHGQSHLYVSRGTGFWGPPMRVGSPPEIVKLVLTSS